MIFNTESKIKATQLRSRVEYLINKKVKVEILHKQSKFTLPQIKYLHLLLKYYGVQVGLTKEEAKTDFKNLNEDIFNYEKKGHHYQRSCASLDKMEMQISISRFIEQCEENGYPMPRPEDREFIDEAINEIESNQTFL